MRPRSLGSSLFPYTTLFRSHFARLDVQGLEIHLVRNEQGQFGLFERALTDQQERSEEHTSELQSRGQLVCRLLPEKKNSHKQLLEAPPNPGPLRTRARRWLQ